MRKTCQCYFRQCFSNWIEREIKMSAKLENERPLCHIWMLLGKCIFCTTFGDAKYLRMHPKALFSIREAIFTTVYGCIIRADQWENRKNYKQPHDQFNGLKNCFARHTFTA